MVLRAASFLPFQTTYYLTGHSFIEQELKRAGSAFASTTTPSSPSPRRRPCGAAAGGRPAEPGDHSPTARLSDADPRAEVLEEGARPARPVTPLRLPRLLQERLPEAVREGRLPCATSWSPTSSMTSVSGRGSIISMPCAPPSRQLPTASPVTRPSGSTSTSTSRCSSASLARSASARSVTPASRSMRRASRVAYAVALDEAMAFELARVVAQLVEAACACYNRRPSALPTGQDVLFTETCLKCVRAWLLSRAVLVVIAIWRGGTLASRR